MPPSHPTTHLTPSDVPLMRGMLAMFAEAFEDRVSYLGNPPSDTDRADVLTTPRVIALAAMDGDQFVGGLVAYQLDKFEQDRREI